MCNNKYNWHESKNLANIKKHGVSFQEAQTVFDDPNAIIEEDDEHSYSEQRFAIIGKSDKSISLNSELLYVCYCERENNEVIRIISARKADKFEIDLYYGGIYETIQ